MADQKLGGDVKGAIGLAILLTLLGLLIDDGTLGILIGLIVMVLVIYAMARAPIRSSMLALMFLALTLPNPAEGLPSPWRPPFFIVGTVLLTHINTLDHNGILGIMSFSAMDILLAALGVIVFLRRSSGSKIDSMGRLPTPKPMIRAAQVALGAAAFTWIGGLVRGGDFKLSLWQLNCVMYLPVVFLLFQHGIRGPKDLGAFAKVLLGAAIYKSLLAAYVINNITGPPDPDTGSTTLAFATSHQDSALFACATVTLIAMVLESVSRRAKWIVALILPIVMLGMMSNHRRLAWVHVGLVFVTVYLVSRDSPVKKMLRRGVLAALPVIGLYVLAGWNSQYGTMFKPVRMIRSVVDAKSDGSSFWRELENYNVIQTFRMNPVLGTGYGHPYEEFIVLPHIDYSLERYIPHNSFLGLWCYTGLIGYAGLTMLWVIGTYFAMRAYLAAKEGSHRAASLVSFGCVLIYMAQSWGDLGLGTWTGVFTVAASLTVASKLAVATGQWTVPSKGEKKRPAAYPVDVSATAPKQTA